MAYPPDYGEEELKWKFERCVNDLILKSIAATTLSFLGAKMFFPKYTKNLTMAGLGGAMGVAWFSCERELRTSMRICKDGVERVVVCEECKKSIEERKKQREQRKKEMEERKKRIEKQMQEEAAGA